MKALLRSTLLVLGSGFVLMFFSETVFWSVWRPGDEIAGRVMAWVLYSVLAYLTLAIIRHFRLADGWGVVLAGAFFGWICEGVVAMTVFGDPSMPFPLTIVWTALAWHAPISLLVGWLAFGFALRERQPWPTLVLSTSVGLFWGAWALGWPADSPPILVPPDEFALHAGVATLGLALAHLAIAAGRPQDFAPSRFGLVLASAAVLAFFAFITVPTVPIAPLVLLPLLGFLWFVLRRHRAGTPEGSVLARLAEPVRGRNLAALALMPIIATAVYGPLSIELPPLGFVHPGFALLTSLAGTALFVVATRRALRRRAP